MVRTRNIAALATTLIAGLSMPAAAHAAPVQADADRDGVFDDLEAKVRSVPAKQDLKVIVMLRSDPTSARVKRIDGDVESLDPARRLPLIDAFAAQVDAGQVRELAARPDVISVARNAPVRKTNDSAQTDFGVRAAQAVNTGLDGGDDVLAAGSYTKEDFVAAVIDTGIDASHLDLDDGKVIAFKDFVGSETQAYDDEGHGTHVAATIAGDGEASGGAFRGVAPAAGLIGLKVLDADGSGSTDAVVAAIQWAVQHKDEFGIEVINLSLGASGCSAGGDPDSLAVNAAAAAGIVVVVAAGNEGPGACTVGSPGAASGALTVGAVADTGAGGIYLAGFSSRGPTADLRTKPDLVAPGVRITSAEANSSDDYASFSGTSMATPFTAGVALLMLDAGAAAANVKTIAMQQTEDWGPAGADNDFGAGLLDANAAVAASGGTAGTSPTLPTHQFLSRSLSDKEWLTLPVESTSKPLAVTLLHSAAGNRDFDIYLFDDDGVLVDRSENGEHGDDVSVQSPTNGPYTLRVEAFSGSGAYTLDTSGVGSVTAAAASTGPVFQTAPAITGTPAEGEVLTADTGSWASSTPLTKIIRWLRCNDDGSICFNVADTPTYELTADDVGSRIALRVQAINRGGTDTRDTALSGVVITSPPVAGSEPVVSGEARDGQTLSASEGSWSGSGTISFEYQWQRCNADGAACSGVAGATTPLYTLTAADVGNRLRVVVTATNVGGAGQASSQPSASVAANPPSNATAPSVAGSAALGSVLSGDLGAWSGTQPISFARQWLRCDSGGASCAAITGATGTDYRVGSDDAGSRLQFQVTASNAGGSVTTVAPPSAVVEQPAPAARAPAGSQPPAVAGRARHGSSLSATDGTWSGTGPTRVTHRWLRCDASGGGCEAIAGATGDNYRLRADDVGHGIRVLAIASNAAGTAEARSPASAPVAPVRPSSLDSPSISGSARRGRLLSAEGGSWWGTPSIAFTVEWLRCRASGRRCVAIDGATRATYLPKRADRGRTLRIRVRAANAADSRTVRSAATAVVRRAPGTLPRQIPNPRHLRLRVAAEPDVFPPRSVVTLRRPAPR